MEPNTIACGEPIEVIGALPEASVDLSIVRPPHTFEDYTAHRAYLQSLLMQLYRVTKPGRRVAWIAADLLREHDRIYTLGADSAGLAQAAGFAVHGIAVWKHLGGRYPRAGTYPHGPGVTLNHQIEWVWLLQKAKGTFAHRKQVGEVGTDDLPFDVMDTGFWKTYIKSQIWHLPRESELPAALVEVILRLWSVPQDTVLIPFLYTGEALLTALQWRRRFFGIDPDPERVKGFRRQVNRFEVGQMTAEFVAPVQVAESGPRPTEGTPQEEHER